jgi:N-acetylmuramoyl-L-alanine amidase
MNIVISSGHAREVRGASCYIDEVDEARRVVDEVVRCLAKLGVDARPFHDDTSHTQGENLETIVDFHNSHVRDLDVSVHFNAYTETSKPMGCEVLYVTQAELASNLSNAMAKFAGFLNRGAKKRTDLYFLNNTEEPAILLEVCFVDSEADVELYKDNFEVLCRAIAVGLSGLHFIPQDIPDNQANITASVFGGEGDYNVSAYDEDKVLNDTDLYVALPDRFEGERPKVVVYNRATGAYATAEIWDVGPWNIDDPYWDKGTRPQAESGTDMTGRTTNSAGIDLSPALASQLNIDGMGIVDWEFEEEE